MAMPEVYRRAGGDVEPAVYTPMDDPRAILVNLSTEKAQNSNSYRKGGGNAHANKALRESATPNTQISSPLVRAAHDVAHALPPRGVFIP